MKFAYGANLKPGSGLSHLKYELHDVHRKWQKPGSLFTQQSVLEQQESNKQTNKLRSNSVVENF